MIEELVARVFYTRNISHFMHWQTKSFAEHMALGEFYESIIGLLDGIVESYQGAFGLIGSIPVPSAEAKDIVEHLQNDSNWIEKNREKISQGNNAVGNLVDGLNDAYLSTIYKLKHLA